MKDIISEFIQFLFSKKARILLIPFLVVLVVIMILFLFVGGSSWSPFIYVLF